MRKALRVQEAQAGVGGRDQEPATVCLIQTHTDVARCGMHIAAVKQTLAYTANLFTGERDSHVRRLSERVKRVAEEGLATEVAGL